MLHKKKLLLTGLVCVVSVILVTCLLLYNGYIWFNNPDLKQYPVRGIDVSAHQNKIDWELVKSQNIDFAYIKATEGKGFIDKYFKTNWENAKKQGIVVGAYHFFTFSSSGADQAKNFIKNVPKEADSLPVVIDIEFGGNSKSIPDRETLDKELYIFINEIKTFYAQEPIIYALYNSYNKYIVDGYRDNKIWIRDIFRTPKLQDGHEWSIWQYSNRARIKGVEGFVDLNVFKGSEEDFAKLISKDNDVSNDKALKKKEQDISKTELYKQAIDNINNRHYPQAIGILTDLHDYKDSKKLLEQLRYIINGSYISNGIWAVSAITADGRVSIAYNGEDINRYSRVESWKNIVSISVRGGDSIEGLTVDGKIITTSTTTKEELLNSHSSPTSAMANVVEAVSSWRNIKCFQTFYPQSAIALSNDGSVYAAYPFYTDGLTKLKGWENMLAVADGRGYAVGIKTDGTVICNNYDYSGTIDISGWRSIVSISADTSLIGLKKDGTVVSTGLNRYGEGNVSKWKDIIAVSTCGSCTIGLKSDGKVVATGQNSYGQMNVDRWADIVAIAAGDYFSIGLKSDGTMVLAGDCNGSGSKTPDVSVMKGLYIPRIY